MALFLVLNRPVTLSSVLKTLPSGVHALTLGCSFSHSSRGTSLSVSLPSSPSLLRFSSPMPFFIITINSPCPPLLEVAGPPSYIPFQLSVLRPSHVPFFFLLHSPDTTGAVGETDGEPRAGSANFPQSCLHLSGFFLCLLPCSRQPECSTLN